MQGVTVHTAGNLGHAVSLTMDTGHSLDFAGKRWGIAGINYMSNLVAAGHADAAAILPTLPTYSQSAVVAAKNMSGMALNEKGLNAQLQALAADLNNPFMMHNASARATRQAAEARVADLTEAGALPQIAEAQKHVDSARQTALNAQAAYIKAARNAQGARAALMAAQAAFGQNPADTAAMDAVMDAIGSVEDANQADAQAKLAYQSNQKALTATQVKLDDLQKQTMASVQAQVKQEIAELRLKQEGAGLNRQTVLDKLLSGFVATARAEEKAGPWAKSNTEIEQSLPPHVSNDSTPLAQTDRSGIIDEGMPEEADNTKSGYRIDAIAEEVGESTESKLVPPTKEIRKKFDYEGLTQVKIDEIVSLPKGKKPKPETYLSSKYIEEHKQSFIDSGAVKIMPTEPSGTIGGKGGTFVMSGDQLESILNACKGDISKIEDALGFDRGYLGGNPIIVEIHSYAGLRLPQGNELGALPEYWLPGGYTIGGIKEAVIDPAPVGTYTYRHVFQ